VRTVEITADNPSNDSPRAELLTIYAKENRASEYLAYADCIQNPGDPEPEGRRMPEFLIKEVTPVGCRFESYLRSHSFSRLHPSATA
jgi:hypothetical protein